MKNFYLALFVLWIADDARSQESRPDPDLQRITDELLAFPDEDIDYSDAYENLVQIMASPLNLNRVDAEELQALHILTDEQIDSLLRYRDRQGSIADIHELQVIHGFDLGTIQRLLPFVQAVDAAARINRHLIRRALSPGHSYVVARYGRTLETPKGFRSQSGAPPAYVGSAEHLYFRFRSSLPGDYSVGITGEKDPGERLDFDPAARQWIFDHVSWHLQLQNKGRLKNMIAGDYQAQFGQGLVLGSAFGLGKGGAGVTTLRRTNLGFRPYTSVSENAYRRGLATTVALFGDFHLSAFHSFARRDATGDSVTVSSFPAAGYHRTAAEILNRKKVGERHTGAVIQYKRKNADTGVIFSHLQFDKPVSSRANAYNQHRFTGSEILNLGSFLNYRIANLSFFAEGARSYPGGWACLAGVLLHPLANLELGMLYRNYDRNYHGLHSNAFSENSEPRNEEGVYWSWIYRWGRQYSFGGYVDMFRFPWLGFRRYRPAEGYEWLLRTQYQPSRRTTVFVQYREEVKAINNAETSGVYKTTNAIRRHASLQCNYGIGEAITIKTRVQYNTVLSEGLTFEGWALMHDLAFRSGPFTLTARHALFDTDDYVNRHYAYEHDAWMAYSLPAYTGTGVRNYVLFEYKINKMLALWMRYSRSRLLNTDEIGSGQDVIKGNTKNDVKFQARLTF